jgi:hypothetical protein
LAHEAVPNKLPVKLVEVKEVNPVIVVAVAPRETAVEPMVTEEFCNCALLTAPCREEAVMLPVKEVAVKLLFAPKVTVDGRDIVIAPVFALTDTSLVVPAIEVTPPLRA